MADKASSSLSPVEDVASPPPPPTQWRRTSRRLTPVEVIDRDYLLRRPIQREPSTAAAADPDGPSAAKRECPQPDQCQQKQRKEETETETEPEPDPYKCPLCLEGVRQRQPVSTKCGHVFCHDCLEAALRRVRKCPLCNARLRQHPFIRIYL